MCNNIILGTKKCQIFKNAKKFEGKNCLNYGMENVWKIF